MAPDAPKTIVGRAIELAQLTDALDSAQSGRGQIVLIGGEPGIGKTRLLEEAIRYAQDRDSLVISVRNYEDFGAPAYWPWIQAVKSVRDESGASEVLDDLQDGSQVDSQHSPNVARFRLFDSTTLLFKSVAKKRLIVLTLDDLQWADSSSLRLLQFFGGEIANSRILVAGTFRDVHQSGMSPLTRTVADLNRERHCIRLSLPGLDDDQIATLMNQQIGKRLPERDVRKFAERTNGNPFFVEEIAQAVTRGGDVSELPPGLRDMILSRVAKLSKSCQELLKTASVVGTEFSSELLDGLFKNASVDDLFDQLDEAAAAGLIVNTETPGRFRFKHDLVRETLVGEISSGWRTKLHARIATELDSSTADAADLAYHFRMARPILGPDKLIEYASAAAHQAIAVHAFEDAIEHFQTALEAIPDNDPNTEAAELLFGLSRAQARAYGRLEQQKTVDSRVKAFNMMLELGNQERAIHIASAYFPLAYHGPVGMVSMLETALSLVEPDSAMHCQLLSAFGQRVSIETGDFARALKSHTRALSIAREQNDVRLELLTMARMLSVYLHSEQEQVLQENLAAAQRLTGQVDVPEAEVEIYSFISQRLKRADGDPDAVVAYAHRALDAAKRTHGLFELITALTNLIRLAVADGRWEEAREYINQGLSIDPTEKNILHESVVTEASLGAFDAATEHIRTLIDLANTTRKPDLASAAVNTVVEFNFLSASGYGPDVLEHISSLCLQYSNTESLIEYRGLQALAHRALVTGDLDQLGEIWERVEPRWGDQSRCFFLWKLGRIDEAEKAFERYLAQLEASDMRPLFARIGLQYAELLIDRNALGDRQRAKQLLEKSTGIARDLGMKPTEARLTEQAARLDDADVDQNPDGLTQRESEVLRLIALGRSNQQIANELYISRHTVNNHVAHIFQKLNVKNRVEAATYAVEMGLSASTGNSE